MKLLSDAAGIPLVLANLSRSQQELAMEALVMSAFQHVECPLSSSGTIRGSRAVIRAGPPGLSRTIQRWMHEVLRSLSRSIHLPGHWVTPMATHAPTVADVVLGP
jgi:hypothetical protein